MARGLDHIVHAVHDLDAVAEVYRRAGFTVGARNRHPWGTHNCIVQLPGFFVELITVGEPELVRMGAPGTFSFGAFVRDFLAREQGLAMLVLEGKGAQDDVAAFRDAGIGSFKIFDFEREAKRPDGASVRVAFSLAFAADAKAPDTGYFTCQQHHPENFWNTAFQQHANGATGVAGIILVAERPQDHREFMRAFSGAGDLETNSGFVAKTPRGEIQVMTPSAYRTHTAAEPPDGARGARLAAVRFAVPDTTKAISICRGNGVEVIEHDGRAVIQRHAAFGATLIFEASK